MPNPKDFFAKQVRTTQIIASGSHGHPGDPWTPGLMIYSASSAPDFEGTLPDSMLADPSVGAHVGSGGLLVGTDVYLFVSGTQGSDGRWSLPGGHDPAVVLFGGDVVISGTLYAERQVIEVDLAQEGDLLLSGNFRAQDQQYPGAGWVRFVGPISSSNFNILSLDSLNLRAGFGTNTPDNPVHIIGASATTAEVADQVFDPTNETDSPLKLEGLYEYNSAEFGGSAARNLVIDEDGVVKYGFTTIGLPCNENACDGSPDNTFTDGLFVDWDENTLLGCALDRVNEVLGQLAPPPAPLANCLGNARVHNTEDFSGGAGVPAPFIPVLLSESPTPGWINDIVDGTQSLSPAGQITPAGLDDLFEYSEYIYIGIPEDIRAATSPTEEEWDIRVGALYGDITAGDAPWLRFRINFDDLGSGTGDINHPATSFGQGDTGILKLYLNGAVVDSHDLTDPAAHGVGVATGLSVGPSEPAHFDTGEELCTYFHRTYGFAKISPNDMEQGWNWCKIVHENSALGDIHSNYVTWIVDDNDVEPTVNGTMLSTTVNGSNYLSGVQYHTAGNLQYRYEIQNAYMRVYSPEPDAISWNTTRLAPIPGEAIPSTPAGIGDVIDEDRLFNIIPPDAPADWLLNDQVSVTTNVKHPFDSPNFGPNGSWGPGGWVICNSQGSVVEDGYLLYNPSVGDTIGIERFRTESFRLEDEVSHNNYDEQSDMAGAVWDSSIHLTVGDNDNGLMCFNDRLISPRKTQHPTCGNAPNILNGDFTVPTYSWGGNPDYSTLGSSISTFYRKFENNSGGDEAGWSVLMSGDCEIVPSTTSPLGANQIHVYFKLPENTITGAPGTGWMDLGSVFNANNWSTGDGLHVGTFNSTIGAATITNQASIGTRSVRSGDSIIMKIEARKSWAGHISQIEIDW